MQVAYCLSSGAPVNAGAEVAVIDFLYLTRFKDKFMTPHVAGRWGRTFVALVSIWILLCAPVATAETNSQAQVDEALFKSLH